MRKNKKISVAINTNDLHVKRDRDLYIIGACACLLADKLSDFDALPLLRPLIAINNDLRSLSTVPAVVPAMNVFGGCEDFTKKIERGAMTSGRATKESIEQFSFSADLANNIIDAMYKVDTKDHEALSDEIESLVAKSHRKLDKEIEDLIKRYESK